MHQGGCMKPLDAAHGADNLDENTAGAGAVAALE